jgi:hypothetical protein
MVKKSHPSKKPTRGAVLGICDEVPRNETMHKSEHGVLDGANGIEMPTVTNRMLRTVHGMWLIGAHDAKKDTSQLKQRWLEEPIQS